ncbi:hypothetical protein OHS17_06465 [Streptomyces sp. NBC_00523]|uniref:hypothetical protein n=1 Tax=Streptomyces sp. NBC_00523 TaxID=2975765 RepID=UPI002E7FE746|nr:hypothetical protein [Streptomyces sp. NBC_00523]WUC99303.1 hypothetical protein OHS17_06465 [Streptomyces sp. NBC_00523]
MSESPGAVPLPADWAVLGKRAGRSMGYEVLDGSLPKDRAQRYLWTATTGTPDGRDPDGELPWRVFLSTADGEDRPVCAVVDTTWDGSKDGTGTASYTWRLLLTEWRPAARAGVTWTSLDRAAARTETPPGAEAVLHAERTPASELADTIDRLGFDWAAGAAALLLDGRHLVITAPRGGTLPGIDERVRVLDAVCALLPYGCRTWLSGATWAGKTEHALRLVFAGSARSGQLEIPLATGRAPSPGGDIARTYLAELSRVRAKRESTADVVAHLLAATAPVPLREGADAVRVLRELDLLDSVLEAVRQGRGQTEEIGRLLALHTLDTVDERGQRELVSFLARTAVRPDDGAASALLARHWTPRVPDLLAADVLAQPASKETFALARKYLSLTHALEGAGRTGAFGRLLTALATAPGYDPVWAGQLAYMAEREYGYHTDATDRVLLASPEAGLAWVRGLFTNHARDMRPLERLLAPAAASGAGPVPGWLRFAGALTGRHAAATEADATAFVGDNEEAWRIALETARDHVQPGVISPLWPVLRDVVRGGRRAELLTLLDDLARPGDPGLPPDAAADADLLWLTGRAADPGSRPAAALPRLRGLTDGPPALDRYADTLVARTDGDPALRDDAIAALLGDRPDPVHGWPVLTRWMRQRPSIETTVGEGLSRRLMAADYAHWLDLDLPADLVEGLERSGLGWLRAVRRLRLAVNARAELDELARIIISGCPHRSVTGRLLDEVAALVGEHGSAFGYALTTELDRQQPGIGLAVYEGLGRDARYGELCARLVRYSNHEEVRHRRIIGALSTPAHTVPPAGPYQHRPYPPAAPPSGPQPQTPAPGGPRGTPPPRPDGHPAYPPASAYQEERPSRWGFRFKKRGDG